METTHNSVKVELGIKVKQLEESLVGWEVTVGQGSECHLTFVRGRLHIAEGRRSWNITTQERKVCDVKIEIFSFVVDGSVKLTVPPNRQ